MNITVKIDENVVAMQAFVKVVTKCYENKGVYRDLKARRKIREALINPEHYFRLDIDPNKVFADYEKIKLSDDVDGYDLYRDIDVEQLTEDILNVCNVMIDSPDDFGDMPFINAGKWLEMINDKLYGYYKTGHFGEGHDDSYFLNVLEEQMKIYSSCKSKDKNKDNAVDVEKISQNIKNEVLKEIMQGIPEAFEKAIYTNLK